jgi:predicted DNA-binding transcriptional regulator AlpA
MGNRNMGTSHEAPSVDDMMARAAGFLSIEPRGLNRMKAAAYVGVSPSLFDEMVGDGRMPSPKKINSRRVWDRRELDDSFDALPRKEERDPWDGVLSA